jgi:co-chaperonin GroES (HSP10)
MSNISKSPFIADPGWIIAKPYIAKDQTFVSEKQTSGDAQESVALSVGPDYTDDHGNLRKTKVKVGDDFLHIYDTNTFEIGFEKYRAVHFSRVIGIKK